MPFANELSERHELSAVTMLSNIRLLNTLQAEARTTDWVYLVTPSASDG